MSAVRPFYFVVVFWGERFRNYLIDFCLPTMLAPGNIPSLSGGRRNRFIFCTTPSDWEALRRTPIFALLDRHIEPCWVEIPPAPPGLSGCEHMGVGHKLAAQMAHRDRAYGVFITPDFMISDGSIGALEHHALAGRRVVLSAALRFAEEPLFENLRAMGLLPVAATGQPLVISGRRLAAAGLRSFHSETLRYEWETPYFADLPAACWWRVPGGDGIVLHSLSWCPMLLDYAAVGEHDTSVLDTWTLDGDYVYRNFGKPADMHVVTDSDEMMIVSWAPLDDRPQSLRPRFMRGAPLVGPLLKGGILRGAVMSITFDPLKRRIFSMPVRWHAGDLSQEWHAVEMRAAGVMARFLPELAPAAMNPRPTRLLSALAMAGRIVMVGGDLLAHSDRLKTRLGQAVRGDRQALTRIRRRIGLVWRTLRGIRSGGT